MIRFGLVLVAIVACPAAATAQDATPGTSSDAATAPATGVEVELGFASAVGSSAGFVTRGFQPGVFVGYQFSRFALGAGFTVTRVRNTLDASPPQSYSETEFQVTLGTRVTALRSADRRTELLAVGEAGIGHRRSTTINGATIGTTTNGMTLAVGPGLRYWMSSSFALGANSGLRYEHDKIDSRTATGPVTIGTLALYVSFVLTARF